MLKPTETEAPAAAESNLDQGAESVPSGEQTATGAAPWQAQMAGDLKDDSYFHQFRTISEAGKSMKQMREQLERSIVIPGDEAPEDEVKAYYQKLGKPDKATDYQFTDIDLPEGMEFQEGQIERMKQFAHNNNLTQKQAQSYYENTVKDGIATYNAIVKQYNAKADAAEKALKDEWGADYKENMELAKRAKTQFLSEEQIASLEKEGAANSPTLLRLLKQVGAEISEGRFVGGQTPKGKRRMMPDGVTPILEYKDM